MRYSARTHRANLLTVTPHPAPSRRRDGFTMPELLIAIIVICVGLLSLASGSAGVLRQMRSGNQSALAAIVATARMENIRSQGCNVVGTGGTATTRGLPETWTFTPISSRARGVVVTVNYVPRPGQTKSVTMTSVVPCT